MTERDKILEHPRDGLINMLTMAINNQLTITELTSWANDVGTLPITDNIQDSTVALILSILAEDVLLPKSFVTPEMVQRLLVILLKGSDSLKEHNAVMLSIPDNSLSLAHMMHSYKHQEIDETNFRNYLQKRFRLDHHKQHYNIQIDMFPHEDIMKNSSYELDENISYVNKLLTLE